MINFQQKFWIKHHGVSQRCAAQVFSHQRCTPEVDHKGRYETFDSMRFERSMGRCSMTMLAKFASMFLSLKDRSSNQYHSTAPWSSSMKIESQENLAERFSCTM